MRGMPLRTLIASCSLAAMAGAGCMARHPGAGSNPSTTVIPGAGAPPGPVEVALTIDDLPRHGPQIPGKEPRVVAAALLSAFARHHLPQVYGFINAGNPQVQPEDHEVLRAWVSAGHPLGNHTWAHLDLEKVPVAEFIADIDRNEATLAELARLPSSPAHPPVPLGWKVFRYPYLREGADPATRDAVRAHLAAHGYRIAQVTIDPWDWYYNDAYVRCLASGADAVRATVRDAFLIEARAKLKWSMAAAQAAAGRPLRHILLLHLGAIDADTIEDLLTTYENLGVRWITLEEAMADPIYGEPRPGSSGGAFLEEILHARGVAAPPHGFRRMSVAPLCQ